MNHKHAVTQIRAVLKKYLELSLEADKSVLDEEEVEPVINDRQVLHIDTGNATPAEAQKTVEKVVEAITEPAVTVLPAVKEPTQPVNHTNPEIRGSLASSIAKTATVSQVELLPPKKANGVQRF